MNENDPRWSKNWSSAYGAKVKCLVCKTPFVTLRARHKFCKPACKTLSTYYRRREARLANNKKWYAEHKAEKNEAQKARRKSNPNLALKDNVRRITREAVRKGILKKEPCVKCKAPAEAHHEDYSKPLQVIWFCRKHHLAHHAKHRQLAFLTPTNRNQEGDNKQQA